MIILLKYVKNQLKPYNFYNNELFRLYEIYIISKKIIFFNINK